MSIQVIEPILREAGKKAMALYEADLQPEYKDSLGNHFADPVSAADSEVERIVVKELAKAYLSSS